MINFSENDCTRLYRPYGRWAHLATPDRGTTVLCNLMTGWAREDGWLGTASQAEYEKAARMRTCPRCRDFLHAHPPGEAA